MAYTAKTAYKDFEDYLLKNGYNAAIDEQNNAIDYETLKNIISLYSEKEGVESDAEELARKAYINYSTTRNELPQFLSANGYTGGMADSHYVSLANTYQDKLGTIERDKQLGLNDIRSRIEQEKKDMLASRSSNVSSLYQQAIKNYSQYAENDEQRNFESYINDGKRADTAAALEQEKAIENAKLELDSRSIDNDNKNKTAQLELQSRSIDNERDIAYSKLEQQKINDELDRKIKAAELLLEGKESTQSNTQSSTKMKLELALAAAEYGDYSLLGELGINVDTSSTESGTGTATATIPANTAADYSNLKTGMAVAEMLAGYGNYSLLSKLTGISEEILKESSKYSGPSDEEVEAAIHLFMLGNYTKDVMNTIDKAYPNISYSQVYDMWAEYALKNWNIAPENAYPGPVNRPEME